MVDKRYPKISIEKFCLENINSKQIPKCIPSSVYMVKCSGFQILYYFKLNCIEKKSIKEILRCALRKTVKPSISNSFVNMYVFKYQIISTEDVTLPRDTFELSNVSIYWNYFRLKIEISIKLRYTER